MTRFEISREELYKKDFSKAASTLIDGESVNVLDNLDAIVEIMLMLIAD